MDDPKARDSRAGRPYPELPDSLAWLYDAPVPEEQAPAARTGRYDDARYEDHAQGPGYGDDPEGLPTLLPFSATPDEPEQRTYGPYAQVERPAPEAEQPQQVDDPPAAGPAPEPEEPAEEPAEEPQPVVEVMPVLEVKPDPVSAPPPWSRPFAPYPPVDEPTPADHEVSLFEPVARAVPAVPQARPAPLPTWHRFEQSAEVPVAVEEPVTVEEPVVEGDDELDAPLEDTVDERAAADEPAAADESAAADEPVTIGEPVEDAVKDAVEEPVEDPVEEREAVEPPAPRPALHDPALGPLWTAVRDSLQASVRHAERAVDVRGLDQSGRRALAALLGVPAVRAATRLDLRELDGIVRAASGLDLATAAERFVPVAAPARRARTRTRTAPVRAGQEWLEAHPGTAARPWTQTWLETVRRDVVGGDTGLTEYEVTSALEILDAVTSEDAPTGWRVRAELAGDVVGDEQALDEGSAVAALVVRGLAAAAGSPPPVDAGARRRLWARFGVVPDLLTTTCLTVGVVPAAPDAPARWLAAAEDGAPVHVTPRDLRAAPGPWQPAVRGWDAVLVVDNARVLEAVAERLPGRVAVVCTDGPAGPVVLDLLERLHAGGAPLRFTLDVDAPGLALGTLLAERFGATPWRMGVEDYRRAVRSDLPPIAGRVLPTPWAPELAAAVTQAGRAVPVEQVLGELVGALAAELPAGAVDAEGTDPRADTPDAAAGEAGGTGQEQAGEVAVSDPELVVSAR